MGDWSSGYCWPFLLLFFHDLLHELESVTIPSSPEAPCEDLGFRV